MQGKEKVNITTGQIGELIAQALAGRITREDLQAFLMNPHGHINNQPSEYIVSVDYGMSLDEMVAAGRYHWKNDDIDKSTFPIYGKDVIWTRLELIHLNTVARYPEVEDYLQAHSLRAAKMEELLAFGAKFPDVQRDFQIVSLNTMFWNAPEYRIPYLTTDGSKRVLDFNWCDTLWGEQCRFLAVRK